MKRSELIEIDETSRFADNILNDLHFDRIFPPSVLKVLSYGCCREEIKGRRDFFRALENPDFENALGEAFEEMRSFEKIKEILKVAQSEVRRLYLRVNLAENFVRLAGKILKLEGYCEKADNYAACFRLTFPESIIEQLAQTVKRMNEILSAASEFCVSFRGKELLSKKYSPKVYYEELEQSGKKIGLTSPAKKSFSSEFDTTLSDAYLSLFSSEAEEVKTLLAKSGNISDYDFTYEISAISFYKQVKEFSDKVRAAGIPVCYPSFAAGKSIHIESMYDITLFPELGNRIVPSDAHFDESEPFCFLIGANGGGKTTYLRAFGVNMVLFMTGCPVFADAANIFPMRKIFVHFPKDERFDDTGRYEEEAARAGEMLNKADSGTLLLFNETFTGTDEKKGSEMTLRVAKEVLKKGAFGLFVTHFLGVESSGFPILQSEVVSNGTKTNKRTFRIIRSKKETHSYAEDILRKYKLDRASLTEKRRSK